MLHVKAAFIAVLIALAASYQAVAAENSPQASVQAGRTVAAEVCAGCHMATPHQMVQPLDPTLPSFQQLADAPGATADSLLDMIHKKHPMSSSPTAAQENISEPDATATVAYILSLRRDQAGK